MASSSLSRRQYCRKIKRAACSPGFLHSMITAKRQLSIYSISIGIFSICVVRKGTAKGGICGILRRKTGEKVLSLGESVRKRTNAVFSERGAAYSERVENSRIK